MNRRVFSLVFAVLVMLLPGSVGFTQDAESPSAFVTGTGKSVTHFDRDGNPVLEIQVTGVEPNWQGFGEYEEPGEGEAYAKVDLSITNVSAAQSEVLPSFFNAYDAMGVPGVQISLSEAEDIWENTTDLTVDSGQTLDGSLVFTMSADNPVAWVTYFPSSPQALIFLNDMEPGSAVASGLNSPATFFSQDRAPMFEMQVTGIEANWQGVNAQIQSGRQLEKVDLTLANVTDQAISVMPYSFSARDQFGRLASTANVSSDFWSVNEIPLGPGESQTGSIIFMMNADSTLMSVTFNQSTLSFVYLGE